MFKLVKFPSFKEGWQAKPDGVLSRFHFFKRFITLTSFLLISLFAFSCSKEKVEPTAVTAYKDAYEILVDKDYQTAGERFEKVSDDFAFSKIASKAQMMAVYAYYKSEEYEEVQRSADDFLTVFPSDKNMDYVLYIKALSYYNVIPQVDRAQGDARKSSMILREIVARFPNSKYVTDSKAKIAEIDRNIAGSLMSKGRYFMDNEKYIAAINNFQKVAARYRHTNQICEAHYRLMEVSFAVGVDEWVLKYAGDLKRDCKGSAWMKKSDILIGKL